MVGVQLTATFSLTRKLNGDKIQETVKNVIGPWKGGKFMPLIQRPYSVNSFCISKICFRSASINLREGDFNVINSQIKSWVFADQLEYPEEMVLYRSRDNGGLGLTHAKYKATAELIRSFLETALVKSFIQNSFHAAQYQWNVLLNHEIPDPGKSPYLTEDMFSLIREVKDEGLLNLSNMKSGTWYKVLIENKVTMQTEANGTRILKACRTEVRNPEVDWSLTWNLANSKGLNPEEKSFLWKMLHNILPTQERLFHLKMKNTPHPNCLLCDKSEPENLVHSLVTCPFNSDVSAWLLSVVHDHLPLVQPHQVVLLDLGPLEESLCLPLVWLISNTLSSIWGDRKDKKKPGLHRTRSSLEAKVNILRKSRFSNAAQIIQNFDGLSINM